MSYTRLSYLTEDFYNTWQSFQAKNKRENLMQGKVTYRQQYTRCGKERCRKCREGAGHGPYWYAYWSANGRTISKYIGIQAPPELTLTPQENREISVQVDKSTQTEEPNIPFTSMDSSTLPPNTNEADSPDDLKYNLVKVVAQ